MSVSQSEECFSIGNQMPFRVPNFWDIPTARNMGSLETIPGNFLSRFWLGIYGYSDSIYFWMVISTYKSSLWCKCWSYQFRIIWILVTSGPVILKYPSRSKWEDGVVLLMYVTRRVQELSYEVTMMSKQQRRSVDLPKLADISAVGL